MNLILILVIIVFFVSPLIRCIILNFFRTPFYMLYDMFMYIYHKKWKNFNEYGIDMFVGMFGHGKTLAMTHKARKLYKKYGNKILFVSNYKLYGIPYVPLVNFNQLLEIGDEEKAELEPPFYSQEEIESGKVPEWYYDKEGNIKMEYVEEIIFPDQDQEEDSPDQAAAQPILKVKRWKYQGVVVLIDEIEDLLSHRKFANFPFELLNVLTQQRKKHVYMMTSAQRFFMVDKIFRGITTFVIDCSKRWRYQSMRYYDAWDYENAVNPQLVAMRRHSYWFVTNRDYESYSTSQMISRSMSEDFISNDEKLARLGLDNVVNEAAIKRPSKRLIRQRKNRSIK